MDLVHATFGQFVAVIAAYWTVVLALGIAGIFLLLLSKAKRLLGALLLMTSCSFVIATVFEPEIDHWRHSITAIRPPRAMVIRSFDREIEIERIGASFVVTRLFDVFVAAPEKGLIANGEQIIFNQTSRCQPEEPKTSSHDTIATECIHREKMVPLPPCHIRIDLEGRPPSVEAVARTARISVVKEDDQHCPLFDPHGLMPRSESNPAILHRGSRTGRVDWARTCECPITDGRIYSARYPRQQ